MAGGDTLSRNNQDILDTVNIAARLGEVDPILTAMIIIPILARIVIIMGATRKVKMANSANIIHSLSVLCRSEGSQVIISGI